MHACPLRGVYRTYSFGFVRGPEWCVHACRVSGCGYSGAPMKGPGFVCRVGGFGPCCLLPSRFETCCRGRVYRAGPLRAADLIRRSCCGCVCGAGLVLSDDSIRWSCCGRAFLRRRFFPRGRLDSVLLLRAFLRRRSFPRGRLDEVERVGEGVLDVDRASRAVVVGDRSSWLLSAS